MGNALHEGLPEITEFEVQRVYVRNKINLLIDSDQFLPKM